MKIDKAMFVSAGPPFRAVILTAERFEDTEMFFPLFRLLEAGAYVEVAAPRKVKITGRNGYSLDNVDRRIAEVNPDNYDLLILPGGPPTGGPATLRKIEKARIIARAFMSAGKPVAAICHGPYVLISAGVVKGRRLTGYWGGGAPEEIKAAGGYYENKEVVVDGNLVTSRVPSDLPAFMKEIMNMMARVKTPAS